MKPNVIVSKSKWEFIKDDSMVAGAVLMDEGVGVSDHKLIRLKFVVDGGIDSYSRLLEMF